MTPPNADLQLFMRLQWIELKIGLVVVLLVSGCSYIFGNPFVVKPLPTRPCAGVYSSDSLEVCRDTAVVRR